MASDRKKLLIVNREENNETFKSVILCLQRILKEEKNNSINYNCTFPYVEADDKESPGLLVTCHNELFDVDFINIKKNLPNNVIVTRAPNNLKMISLKGRPDRDKIPLYFESPSTCGVDDVDVIGYKETEKEIIVLITTDNYDDLLKRDHKEPFKVERYERGEISYTQYEEEPSAVSCHRRKLKQSESDKGVEDERVDEGEYKELRELSEWASPDDKNELRRVSSSDKSEFRRVSSDFKSEEEKSYSGEDSSDQNESQYQDGSSQREEVEQMDTDEYSQMGTSPSTTCSENGWELVSRRSNQNSAKYSSENDDNNSEKGTDVDNPFNEQAGVHRNTRSASGCNEYGGQRNTNRSGKNNFSGKDVVNMRLPVDTEERLELIYWFLDSKQIMIDERQIKYGKEIIKKKSFTLTVSGIKVAVGELVATLKRTVLLDRLHKIYVDIQLDFGAQLVSEKGKEWFHRFNCESNLLLMEEKVEKHGRVNPVMIVTFDEAAGKYWGNKLTRHLICARIPYDGDVKFGDSKWKSKAKDWKMKWLITLGHDKNGRCVEVYGVPKDVIAALDDVDIFVSDREKEKKTKFYQWAL